MVLRWDLDKTYLVSHFESLRYLLRVPFQRAEDKVSVPGVAALIKGIRRTLDRRGIGVRVYFLSASPPQIGGAIRDKLTLDGIDYDAIVFKDQFRNLIKARFDAVLEHIGYKLERLLQGALQADAGSLELLFGDDWESDPFIYSLYADVVEGRVDVERLARIVEVAGVNRDDARQIVSLARELRHDARVETIFILRQRPASPQDLLAFGSRLVWFDNYFECSLKLFEIGMLNAESVLGVLADAGLSPAAAAESFDAVCGRDPASRACLSRLRRILLRAKLMDHVDSAPLGRRIRAALRRVLARRRWSRVLARRQWSRVLAGRRWPRTVPVVPDYEQLVTRWSYRRRKEVLHAVESKPHPGVDDRG